MQLNIWFSIEEIVALDTHEFVLPRLRNANVARENQRLGHPSLIGGQDGRIGGEIIFDVGAGVLTWFITNGSGRYGLRAGRKSEHLLNASKRFGKHGIQLREYFIPPRSESLA